MLLATYSCDSDHKSYKINSYYHNDVIRAFYLYNIRFQHFLIDSLLWGYLHINKRMPKRHYS